VVGFYRGLVNVLEELERAQRALMAKGALDEDGNLTDHGMELRYFCEEPDVANLLIIADRFACAVDGTL